MALINAFIILYVPLQIDLKLLTRVLHKSKPVQIHSSLSFGQKSNHIDHIRRWSQLSLT